jgi:hypothetical protein
LCRQVARHRDEDQHGIEDATEHGAGQSG